MDMTDEIETELERIRVRFNDLKELIKESDRLKDDAIVAEEQYLQGQQEEIMYATNMRDERDAALMREQELVKERDAACFKADVSLARAEKAEAARDEAASKIKWYADYANGKDHQIAEEIGRCNDAEAERDAALLREKVLRDALRPLAAIANAYDANNLDDEARKFWGRDNEHTNNATPDQIELYSGRGGKRLLTLADCFSARTALIASKKETGE
ncbi:MAG: hypothetical protein P4L79_10000 [Legionella sp.]|uniref:hypothetical protein n=1 Tax=Legionella sp. TaxID=459 RepID=UPI002850A08A|nr:hypothetical protein [Legionella sp.]